MVESISNHKNKMKVLNWIAVILVIIGGLNWGLVGIAELDLVALIFSAVVGLQKLVYILVGLAAVYVIFLSKKLA